MLTRTSSCWTLPTNTSMSVSKPTDCDIVNATVNYLRWNYLLLFQFVQAVLSIYIILSFYLCVISCFDFIITCSNECNKIAWFDGIGSVKLLSLMVYWSILFAYFFNNYWLYHNASCIHLSIPPLSVSLYKSLDKIFCCTSVKVFVFYDLPIFLHLKRAVSPIPVNNHQNLFLHHLFNICLSWATFTSKFYKCCIISIHITNYCSI